MNNGPHNIPVLNSDDLGKAIRAIMAAYEARGRNDNTLACELITFENRYNGANEWLQMNLTLTRDPCNFIDKDEVRRGYANPYVTGEVVKRLADLVLEVINICEAELVRASTAAKITDAAEIRVMEIVKLMSNS